MNNRLITVPAMPTLLLCAAFGSMGMRGGCTGEVPIGEQRRDASGDTVVQLDASPDVVPPFEAGADVFAPPDAAPPDAAPPDAGLPAPDAQDASLDVIPTLYPTAYLAWEAPGGAAGTGPAVVVTGAGRLDTWLQVSEFSPEVPPTTPAPSTETLDPARVADLFARLAALDVSQLPHQAAWIECYVTLYYRLCDTCAATTLEYNRAPQVSPEMETVWAWFDAQLGPTARTNPRNFCNY